MMYQKKGWILAASLLILCSVGCTRQTGETHRLYVQTAGSESQIAETLPTAEQAEWMDADSNAVSTKAVKTKKATKTTTKKKKSSKKKTTTKQKKETTAKVTMEKAAKTTKPKTTKASKTTTAPRIAATMPRENLFRTTTVRNQTENVSNRTTKTTSKAEYPASAKITTLKTNVVIRTQPPVPVTIAPVETNSAQPEQQQTDKYLSLSDGEMQGAGIVVSGNQIFLQAAGIYHLSGNWNGSICVQAGATDAIELRLEGASICGVDAPAIQIQQAGMVTITTADHTENTILAEQGVTAIDSSSALQLQGTGALQIQNESGNGITCTDAITITEGMLSIAARDTAILSGRDSQILDGMVIANGGQAGIHCDGKFSVEDGTLLTTGTNVNTASIQPSAQFTWKEIIASGHTVSFQINGIEVAKTVLQFDAETFFLTCPDLTIGNNVDFLIDGMNVKTFEQQEQNARWNEKNN